MAMSSWKRAGKRAVLPARLKVTMPVSRGARSACRTLALNCAASSRKRTPPCAREISPGRSRRPPPAMPSRLALGCGSRKGGSDRRLDQGDPGSQHPERVLNIPPGWEVTVCGFCTPPGWAGGELTKWVLNTPPGSQQQVWVFCTPPGSQQSLGELNAAPGSQHTVWVFDSPAGCQPESGELSPPESGKPARLWMRVTVTAVSLSRRGRRAGNRVRARVLPLPGGP